MWFILCHFCLPVHDIWFNSCSFTHLWSSFIRSLLVWIQTISLSSHPPSQSSVDHKEFKRCGPFDPYINAKVCTQCCQNISFFKCFFALLLCWLAVGLLVCCCCLRGHSAAEKMGMLLFHSVDLWLSSHVCFLCWDALSISASDAAL